MKITLLSNPIAGKGRASAAAQTLQALLREQGHAVRLAHTNPTPRDEGPGEPERSDLLVVLGGDGSVRLASETAVRTETPLYVIPLGTENLFARELGMGRSGGQLLDALRRFEVRHLDVGKVDGRNFLLMTSLGFDACVVCDLADRRGGAINHLSYVRPLLRQLWRWRPPQLTLDVDGERVVAGRTGFLVIANSRQYAVRLDPALRASMTDGLLDVVFFPCRSAAALPAWALACRLRSQLRSKGLVYRQGRRMLVRCAPAQPYQLDGDAPQPRPCVTTLEVGILPRALPVLAATSRPWASAQPLAQPPPHAPLQQPPGQA